MAVFLYILAFAVATSFLVIMLMIVGFGIIACTIGAVVTLIERSKE